MSDVHLRILRAAAVSRARQLQAIDDPADDTSTTQRPQVEKLAARARRQLSTARARRPHAANRG
jgi:hypothetical protein